MVIDGELEISLERLARVLGYAGICRSQHRVDGLLPGLMLPLKRKSVEPLAASIDPLHVQAKHQWLHHFGRQCRLFHYAHPRGRYASLIEKNQKQSSGQSKLSFCVFAPSHQRRVFATSGLKARALMRPSALPSGGLDFAGQRDVIGVLETADDLDSRSVKGKF